MKKLSASIVSQGFWFREFVATASMLNSGKSWNDVDQAIIEDNVFQLSSKNRQNDVRLAMHRRYHELPDDFTKNLDQFTLSNQKLINLVAIMKMSALVEDFVLTVVKTEFVMGDLKLEPYEIGTYMRNLPLMHPEASHWRSVTVKKLKNKLREYLVASGLAEHKEENLVLQRAVLDPQVERLLKQHDMTQYIEALTGRQV
ncbi:MULTISPECIES: DUF1819 family protein [Lacticaseibacillus]|uniref:DUF1819 family protein n=3 Tax=Lacticaseibacillus TaxID=2759736 RepID=A0A5R8LTG2_LACZE|nr:MULTISPECIES: DUF1819 family protein [Lacticaseibacillus]KRK12067.1 hypothetical protein FD51_GL000663 [Lacticaseibacillus zeae DSM 20178 = KCTC 3804]MBI6596853.1 DUF1819 family protein [Lacticaseibacillus casei]MBO1480632.1 DUF1819 family protein [Lacticaseibacillus casei]MBO2415911.1 DUF1819 family protein [Lacticaseibacillus casei]MCK2081035.1 DUF1819 family protein [Lacticaseibacillus casei]